MSKSRKILFFMLIITIVGAFSTISQCSAESFMVKFEKEIGFSSYQQIVRDKRVITLPEAKAQSLYGMFNRLTQASSRHNEIKYSLTVVEDPEVNAYALPGGYVFINTGLLDYAETEGEVAGVLAHEIAHIDRKHGINAVSRAVGFSIVLQLVTNKSDNPDRTAQIGALTIGLAQKGYSRGAEYEADRYGVRFMTAAGYSKNEMVSFFRKLEKKYGSGSNFALLQLVSTHPPTSERIKQIENM
ncbi:MAG TPA: M48 family metallopeptidase [Bacillota bacterium]|nr:M48 family metallopeptidase [Bacillota bacterium]